MLLWWRGDERRGVFNETGRHAHTTTHREACCNRAWARATKTGRTPLKRRLHGYVARAAYKRYTPLLLWWRRAPVIDRGVGWMLSGLLTVLVVGCDHPNVLHVLLNQNCRRTEANQYHHEFRRRGARPSRLSWVRLQSTSGESHNRTWRYCAQPLCPACHSNTYVYSHPALPRAITQRQCFWVAPVTNDTASPSTHD
jgi:hypothetical protein